MEKFEVGMLVRSKCGHDEGQIYIIKEIAEPYVYLVDGKIRTLDRAKKKKIKHVQLMKQKFSVEKATDVEIKRCIKIWKKEES